MEFKFSREKKIISKKCLINNKKNFNGNLGKSAQIRLHEKRK